MASSETTRLLSESVAPIAPPINHPFEVFRVELFFCIAALAALPLTALPHVLIYWFTGVEMPSSGWMLLGLYFKIAVVWGVVGCGTKTIIYAIRSLAGLLKREGIGSEDFYCLVMEAHCWALFMAYLDQLDVI